jgi:hypothetical protein
MLQTSMGIIWNGLLSYVDQSESCSETKKGGTTGSSSFMDGGLFLFLEKKSL